MIEIEKFLQSAKCYEELKAPEYKRIYLSTEGEIDEMRKRGAKIWCVQRKNIFGEIYLAHFVFVKFDDLVAIAL